MKSATAEYPKAVKRLGLAIEQAEFDGLTQEEKDLTIAFFAKDDEVVRHGAEFEKRYGKPGISYPGLHLPVFPEMKEYIVPEIIKFLEGR